jgi:uncharacterized lipoprotein NlpE involved in copper resistance
MAGFGGVIKDKTAGKTAKEFCMKKFLSTALLLVRPLGVSSGFNPVRESIYYRKRNSMIKKSFTMICVALVVTVALVLTGCDNDAGDDGGTSTVASVTVSPSPVNVPKGGTQAFTATVSGTGNPVQTVTWSVSGGGAGTVISESGVLTVAAGESVGTLTVTATSTVDTSKSGTATVTVTDGSGEEDVDKTFTIGYEWGTIIIKNEEGNTVTDFTLSNSTVTLSADDTFSSVTWYVDGVNKSTNPSLELKAEDYTTTKTHSVTFTGWLNGSYLSSGPILFTVTN